MYAEEPAASARTWLGLRCLPVQRFGAAWSVRMLAEVRWLCAATLARLCLPADDAEAEAEVEAAARIARQAISRWRGAPGRPWAAARAFRNERLAPVLGGEELSPPVEALV
ncbi:MAG: hypothetical protein ACK4ZJ_16995, partial [Allorhizobium sp.]